jgi:hypothetical protein
MPQIWNRENVPENNVSVKENQKKDHHEQLYHCIVPELPEVIIS